MTDKKQIKIDDFLSAVSKEMAIRDNACTAKPLYCVYQKRLVLVPEPFGEIARYFDEEGCALEENDVVKKFESFDNLQKKTILDEYDSVQYIPIDILAERMGLKKFFCKIDNVPVPGQVYLTKKAAQTHIDANHYHYNKPFVYVEGAWRNTEMQKIMQFIYNIENKGKYAP